MNSRAKGANGERMLAKYFRDELGFPNTRRGQQFKGTSDSPDVQCDDLPGILIECKRDQRVKPGRQEFDDAWRKVSAEAHEGGKCPVLFYKQDREPWMMVCQYHGLRVIVHRPYPQRELLVVLSAAAVRESN